MSGVLLKNSADSAQMAMDWTPELPTGVTLSSVTHTVPAPLTKVSESNTQTASSVKVSGGVHGTTYQVSGAATLSNGEMLNRAFAVRLYDSA